MSRPNRHGEKSGARCACHRRHADREAPAKLVRRHYDRLWPSTTLSRVGSKPRLSKGEGPGSGPVMNRQRTVRPVERECGLPEIAAAGARLERHQTDYRRGTHRAPATPSHVARAERKEQAPVPTARGNESPCPGRSAARSDALQNRDPRTGGPRLCSAPLRAALRPGNGARRLRYWVPARRRAPRESIAMAIALFASSPLLEGRHHLDFRRP